MQNLIQQMTKDCASIDCAIHQIGGGVRTSLGWVKVYDKLGNRIDKGDPNITTSKWRCEVCGLEWKARTQYGQTTVSLITNAKVTS